MRDDDSKIADAELIMEFFGGSDASEEKARAALARVVRDYIPGFSGEWLALALDPDTPSRFVGMTPTRRIKFERRGRASTWRRNLLIAEFIRQQLAECEQHEAAYAAAAEKFRISRSTAQSIWQWRCDAMKDATERELWRARN